MANSSWNADGLGSKVFKSCYKCHDRHQGCHNTCEQYLKARIQYAKMVQQERDQPPPLNKYDFDNGRYIANKRRK